MRLLFPIQAWLIRRSFRISDASYAKAVERIETLLADVDERLADERGSLLGGDELNYTDIAFAAISGVWLMPQEYGAGRAESVRIEEQRAPADMRN